MSGERATAAIRVDVYVQPRASRTAVKGQHDGCVKIALDAPPVEGASNAELIASCANCRSALTRPLGSSG
jgi:uncharacterized protein YggU (UPF0235/DUF167 family)